MKRFKIIEYCTGDFGDLGKIVGEIEAENHTVAREKFKLENNIKDSEIGFYSFREINPNHNCKVKRVFDVDKAVADFKTLMRMQGYKVYVLVNDYEPMEL